MPVDVTDSVFSAYPSTGAKTEQTAADAAAWGKTQIIEGSIHLSQANGMFLSSTYGSWKQIKHHKKTPQSSW